MEAPKHPQWLLRFGLLLFALSGCAGLIYQSIWSHYLGLFLGHAAYAQSLVLAIFMGGMAIGAWLASRYSIGWRNLIRMYAAIELAIGLAGAAFHPVFDHFLAFSQDTAFPSLSSSLAVQSFKWISGALLILPQSILLGMTFPLMSNGLIRRVPGCDGATLGGLYFTNSIGAALGALIATFILLPAIGLPGAMRVGASLNVLVALGAFIASRRHEDSLQPALMTTTKDHAGIARVLLVTAFFTGATSFVYEIGWVRMLSLAFGSTVHAFELMLAAFIGGLAFGGLWIRRRIDAYASPMRVGGWVQILMGLAALASLMLYDQAFDWVAWFLESLSNTDGAYALYNTVTAAVSMLMMAPAAFFAGMTLPLFTLALMRAGGGEAAVGRIYAANTIGAILGVFLAVHMLLPMFGLKLAMSTAAAGDLVLGLILLHRTRNPAQTFDGSFIGALAGCAAAFALVIIGARFDPAAMAAGVYRSGIARLPEESGTKVLFYRDGKTASIAMLDLGAGNYAISTNGKVDASIGMTPGGPPAIDEITMALAAALPLLHHPEPRTAAVIGFGSGLSTHTLLGDSRLERVDTIEIEPTMIEAARLFGDHVERAYTDPRSHLVIEDARTYFSANHTRYDLIMSEPSNPWVSGVASLFSGEFYSFIPRHLAPGGLFVQWIQLYEIDDELVATIVNALDPHFSDYRIYRAHDADMVIVARADGNIEDIPDHPVVLDEIGPELARLGVGTRTEILTHQIGDKRSLRPLFGTLSPRRNSDYYPILSLEAPRTRFEKRRADTIYNLAMSDLPYREILAGIVTPPSASVNPVSGNYQKQLQQATHLSAALLDNDHLDTRAPYAQSIAFLQEAVGRCKAHDDTDVIGSLIDAASVSLPYLDHAMRQRVWAEQEWIQCDQHSETVRRLLDVIAALARGDGASLEDGALELAGSADVTIGLGSRDWLFRAATLGAVMQRDFAAVESMEQGLGPSIRPASSLSDALRRWVRQYALDQRSNAAQSLPAEPNPS